MVTDSTKYGTTAPLQAAPIMPDGALQMQIQATQQPNHDPLGCTTASATTPQLHSHHNTQLLLSTGPLAYLGGCQDARPDARLHEQLLEHCIHVTGGTAIPEASVLPRSPQRLGQQIVARQHLQHTNPGQSTQLSTTITPQHQLHIHGYIPVTHAASRGAKTRQPHVDWMIDAHGKPTCSW
jgi:hypothetical protein